MIWLGLIFAVILLILGGWYLSNQAAATQQATGTANLGALLGFL